MTKLINYSYKFRIKTTKEQEIVSKAGGAETAVFVLKKGRSQVLSEQLEAARASQKEKFPPFREEELTTKEKSKLEKNF